LPDLANMPNYKVDGNIVRFDTSQTFLHKIITTKSDWSSWTGSSTNWM